TTSVVCAPHDRRQVVLPSSVRQAILRDYGVSAEPTTAYELDYLVTPELGGVADRRNLWPEHYGGARDARGKDQLEDLLPRLVCAGEVDLATAQREIASNWVEAYKKYFNTSVPRRIEASTPGDDDGDVIFADRRAPWLALALQIVTAFPQGNT